MAKEIRIKKFCRIKFILEGPLQYASLIQHEKIISGSVRLSSNVPVTLLSSGQLVSLAGDLRRLVLMEPTLREGFISHKIGVEVSRSGDATIVFKFIHAPNKAVMKENFPYIQHQLGI